MKNKALRAPVTENNKSEYALSCITRAARQAAGSGPACAAVERFLRTGNSHLSRSSRYSLEGIKKERVHSDLCKTALWNLFEALSAQLPAAEKNIAAVMPEMIREKVRPMVTGLVQEEWRETALRELGKRVFVLNAAGARKAIEAELTTSWLHEAWNVFWLFFSDHALRPETVRRPVFEGITAGTFAHISRSAYERDDGTSDVIVHEAAHLLHYLKPEDYGLPIKRGQERFLDVRFIDRELFAYTCEAYTRLLQKGRGPALKSAERIWEICGHYPPRKSLVKEIAALLLKAAKARNGWKVIKERTVAKRGRVWRKQQLHDALFAISSPQAAAGEQQPSLKKPS